MPVRLLFFCRDRQFSVELYNRIVKRHRTGDSSHIGMENVRSLMERMGVQSMARASFALYNTSGGNDFLVHVAATGSDALRNFVLDHLANRPGVVHAETSLIFEATRGAGLLPAGRQP